MDAGLTVVVALISPFRADRAAARRLFTKDDFVEVFVDASIGTCEARDTKGLYAKARRGELPRLHRHRQIRTEPPEDAEIRLDTNARTTQECVDQIHRGSGTLGPT